MANRFKTVFPALFALSFASPSLAATTVTFETTPTGDKTEGFFTPEAPELSFSSAFGVGLLIGDFGDQSDGLGLAVRSESANFLIGTFSSQVDFLSLMFGNDDPSFTQIGDIALLRTFLGDNLIGTSFVTMNRDDALNQTIGFGAIGGGAIFDRFEFVFANQAGNPIGLVESVDNIVFNTAAAGAVPEPSTWAMMLLGFGFIGGTMRSATRRQKITVSYA